MEDASVTKDVVATVIESGTSLTSFSVTLLPSVTEEVVRNATESGTSLASSSVTSFKLIRTVGVLYSNSQCNSTSG